MMGRPPRALKVAREFRTTGAFVLVIGVLAMLAGVVVISKLVAVMFLALGFGIVLLGVDVIRKAEKIARALKGGVK